MPHTQWWKNVKTTQRHAFVLVRCMNIWQIPQISSLMHKYIRHFVSVTECTNKRRVVCIYSSIFTCTFNHLVPSFGYLLSFTPPRFWSLFPILFSFISSFFFILFSLNVEPFASKLCSSFASWAFKTVCISYTNHIFISPQTTADYHSQVAV